MAKFDASQFSLDHIGIAVKSLDDGSALYRALGFKDMYTETVAGEKVRVGMFELANGARIELLEPTEDDSPVGKFLAKRGPGIHHICFKVPDIRSVMHQLKQSGIRLINDEPKAGAHNCLVAFIHPQSAGGVLVELSESQD